MAYTNQVEPVNFFASYLQGRQAAQQQQAADTKNAFAQQQLGQVTRQNALYADPNATPEQFVRAGDTQTGQALQGVQDDKQKAVAQLGAVAQQALTIADPGQRRAFLTNASKVYGQAFTALGQDPTKVEGGLPTIPDDQLTKHLQQLAQFAAPKQPMVVGENQSIVMPDANTPGGFKTVFKGEAKPEDPLAKLNEDHNKGLVSDKDYVARMKMLTTPEASSKPQLVQVPQADGTLQDTWVVPGQSTGTQIGSAKQPGAGGARLKLTFNRSLAAGNEIGQALENITELPLAGTSTGFMGIGAHKEVSGPLQATKAALGNALSTEDVQRYNVMVAGVRRNAAALEAAGLAPGETLTAGMSALELKPGDTVLTKLTRMAEIRQIGEKALEPYLTEPTIAEPQKDKIRSIIAQLQRAVPYTQHDVTMLARAGNPQATIADVATGKGLGTAAGQSPTVSPANQSVPTATGPNGQKLYLRNGQWGPQ